MGRRIAENRSSHRRMFDSTGQSPTGSWAEYSAGKALLYSHSHTGNPLACRVALETLAIFREEPVLERKRALAAHLAAHLPARLASLRDHPHLADVRQTGSIAAVELVADKATRRPFPAHERRGLKVYPHGPEHGAVLRPLGNIAYFMPPCVSTADEPDHLWTRRWPASNRPCSADCASGGQPRSAILAALASDAAPPCAPSASISTSR